jgi:hypothetical protein
MAFHTAHMAAWAPYSVMKIPVSQLAQLLEPEGVRILMPAEGRRVIEGQRQIRMRLPHAFRERDGGTAVGARGFAPHEIHAGIGVGAATPDGFVKTSAHRSKRVRPCDDHEVRLQAVPLLYGGPEFSDRLIARNEHLPADVTAALREPLIFQVNAGNARLDEFLHGAHHAERIPVAVIRVGDDRDLHGPGGHGRRLGNLRHGEEARRSPPPELTAVRWVLRNGAA